MPRSSRDGQKMHLTAEHVARVERVEPDPGPQPGTRKPDEPDFARFANNIPRWIRLPMYSHGQPGIGGRQRNIFTTPCSSWRPTESGTEIYGKFKSALPEKLTRLQAVKRDVNSQRGETAPNLAIGTSWRFGRYGGPPPIQGSVRSSTSLGKSLYPYSY